jgi:hypothetical protein
VVKFAGKLSLTDSLLLPAPAPGGDLSADGKAQSSTRVPSAQRSLQRLFDSLDELEDGILNASVVFSGKAVFSR